jgi:hypothetical protein
LILRTFCCIRRHSLQKINFVILPLPVVLLVFIVCTSDRYLHLVLLCVLQTGWRSLVRIRYQRRETRPIPGSKAYGPDYAKHPSRNNTNNDSQYGGIGLSADSIGKVCVVVHAYPHRCGHQSGISTLQT